MTIYGRMHQPVTIKRLGTLDDVKRLDNRSIDKVDREAVRIGSYVVVDDAGEERLYHLGFLRADEGWREIQSAIDATKVAPESE